MSYINLVKSKKVGEFNKVKVRQMFHIPVVLEYGVMAEIEQVITV